jgi:Tol biopolymer transport system component
MDNRLYVLRSEASDPEVVVDQVGQRGGLRFPTWSPDGTRIAYVTGAPPVGQAYRGLAWLHIVDATTGQDSFLTGFPDQLALPDVTWSPRGDQLLVSAINLVNNHWTIFSVRPDPADPRPTVLISDDSGARASTGFPAFLPGGHAVLVEQDETDYTSSRLYLADPLFKHLVPVSPRPGWETQPDFGLSPLRAVYQQYSDDRSQTSIRVLTLPSGRSQTLVPTVAGLYVEEPDWQPVLGCRPWPIKS